MTRILQKVLKKFSKVLKIEIKKPRKNKALEHFGHGSDSR